MWYRGENKEQKPRGKGRPLSTHFLVHADAPRRVLPEMAPTTRVDITDPARRALVLPEIWQLVASHSTVVDAWRFTGVSRAARDG